MYEYPFGNGQQLNLDWFLSEWKNLLAAWEAEKNGIEGALQAEIDRAEAALADVFAARDAAAQSAANALESKNAAAQSASDASGYLATVRADANTASNAAQNAAQSESNAADSAQTALASKNNAADSASAAAQSAQNANASKDAAAQSAADALANKDAAAQNAADALANKNAAAQSAEDAEDAATSIEASAQQIANNTADIANLKESVFNKAPIIVNTANGIIAHFTDGADDMPVKALTVEGAETATITRTGKNLALEVKKGYISPSGTKATFLTDNEALTVFFECKANYTYTFSGANANRGVIAVFDSIPASGTSTQKSVINYDIAQSITPTADGICGIYFYIGTSTIDYSEVQIEIGSTATPYEPHQSETFNYPSEEITTLYGVNNIWSDSGQVNVSYYADTKLYTDSKIAELQAMVLENIGG